MKHINIDIREVGPIVVCDCCGEDWTNRTESGGFLFGSNAYCPTCAPVRLVKIKGYKEERYIKAYCPSGMSFKDWVLKLRGGDNTIKIISVEDR